MGGKFRSNVVYKDAYLCKSVFYRNRVSPIASVNKKMLTPRYLDPNSHLICHT